MPYPVDYGKTETLKTYLDTTGRPVLVAHKSNLVEQHIQDFEVIIYCFNSKTDRVNFTIEILKLSNNKT